MLQQKALNFCRSQSLRNVSYIWREERFVFLLFYSYSLRQIQLKMEGILLGLVLMIGISSATVPPPPPPETGRLNITNMYIVLFKKKADVKADSTAVSKIPGVHIQYVYRNITKGLSVQLTSPSALQKIQVLPFVEDVIPDGEVTIQENSMTWGLDRLDERKLPLNGQNNFQGNGQGVNVYIIDTGIYPDHEYFGGRARVGFDAVNDGRSGIDCHGHGTHCAGTIGADYYGIARGANLYGVRVLSCWGWGWWSWVIAGMDWVAANHVSPAVVSMSLGGYRNEAVNEAVRGLTEAGVTVAVAAGNSRYDACRFSPAGAPSAITVGASDHKDYRAWFSNYGSCVDIFAPGVNVLSTMIGSRTATATWSGTSMACPHVAGAAAIALGNDPTLTPEQVCDKLKAASTSGVLQEKGPLSPDSLLYIP